MRRAALALLLLLVAACPALAGTPGAAGVGAGAIACVRGGEAFAFEPPPGWGNLRATAEEFGLCGMLSPGITGFHEAPALIYPNTAAITDRRNPVDVFAESTAARFRVMPGGEGAKLRPGETVVSDSGLLFELRYLDDGPNPNNFEVLAVHTGKNALFLLVLTATRAEDRLRYLPDFIQALKSARAFEPD